MSSAKFKYNVQLESEIKKRLIKALDKAGVVLQNQVKNELSGNNPRVRTGTLRRSIQVDRSNVRNGSVRIGTNLEYAKIQNFGGVITAKRAKYLKFKIDGLWKTVKSVIIPGTWFFNRAFSKSKRKILAQFKGII